MIVSYVFLESMNKRKRKKCEKYDDSRIQPEVADVLDCMSHEMAALVQSNVETKNKENPKKKVSKDNCTIFDVYQVVKRVECVVSRIEKLSLDNEKLLPADIPFVLPLKTVDDLRDSEAFFAETKNKGLFVSFNNLLRFL